VPYRLTKDIFVFQSSIWQTNSVVILNEAANITVDPAYFPAEIQVIADLAARKRSFGKYLVFTHADFDHIVGHQYFRDARKIAHENFLDCDREAQLEQLKEIDDTYYVRRQMPFEFPEVDITFKDQYALPLKEDMLLFYPAPGHTNESVFIVSPDKKVLIAGDYLSDLEFPFIYYNSAEYLRTLELAARLTETYELGFVVPGHGEPGGTRAEILRRVKRDQEYIERLTNMVREYLTQGLQEKEILEVMKEMEYDNELITGLMVRMHLENVRQVMKEFYG